MKEIVTWRYPDSTPLTTGPQTTNLGEIRNPHGVQEFDRHLPWDAHGQRVLLLETQGFGGVVGHVWTVSKVVIWYLQWQDPRGISTIWQNNAKRFGSGFVVFQGKTNRNRIRYPPRTLQYSNTNMAGWKSAWILCRGGSEFRSPQVMDAKESYLTCMGEFWGRIAKHTRSKQVQRLVEWCYSARVLDRLCALWEFWFERFIESFAIRNMFQDYIPYR